MKRRLGNTGLVVNEIGLGGIPIQRLDKTKAGEIVTALERTNINFIDTARGYTISEELLGDALVGRRDKFILATKSMARTYEQMKKDINISLECLKTNYIDLYQIHNLKKAEEYQTVMGKMGAYRALLEAKAEGKIGHIGITSHSLDLLESVIDKGEFETIQFPYNVIERQAEDLFLKAHQLGLGIIVMKPLAGGMFQDVKLPINFILNNENVSVVIIGMESVEQVLENSAIRKRELLADEVKQLGIIQQELGYDFCRRCGYCLPCSAGIDIPSCFMFESYYQRYNLQEWAKSRYLSMKHLAEECIKCGQCERRCPYKIKIMARLEEVIKIFKD